VGGGEMHAEKRESEKESVFSENHPTILIAAISKPTLRSGAVSCENKKPTLTGSAYSDKLTNQDGA